jgi:hypothetical protein
MSPSKGNTMKTGSKKAISVNGDIIMFVNPDIKHFSPEWIDKLIYCLDDFLTKIGKQAADSKSLSTIES